MVAVGLSGVACWFPARGWRSGLTSTHPAPRQYAGGCHDHMSGTGLLSHVIERGAGAGSCRKSTGAVVEPAYLEFAFPYYWHYDVLRALDYFRRSGAAPDPRMAEAVAVVQSRRQPGGRWLLDRIHPGRVHFDLEGGAGTPSRWNTLRALRVLKWWDGIA